MTSIYFLLDRSGSMEGRVSDVIKGFNDFLHDHQQLDDCDVSLYTFSSECTPVFQSNPASESRDLTGEDYTPSGSTALLDAMGMVLDRIPSMSQRKQVLIVITDGEENSSHKFSRRNIRTKVEERQGLELLFIGSNQDAILNGSSLGGRQRTCLEYVDNCLYEAMRATSGAVYRYSSNMDKEIEFTQAERQSSMN